MPPWKVQSGKLGVELSILETPPRNIPGLTFQYGKILFDNDRTDMLHSFHFGTIYLKCPCAHLGMTDSSDFDARLGATIREARLDAGYTQEEIARALGVTAATIARHELGIRRLSVSTLLQIAAVLELPLSQLIPGAAQL